MDPDAIIHALSATIESTDNAGAWNAALAEAARMGMEIQGPARTEFRRRFVRIAARCIAAEHKARR